MEQVIFKSAKKYNKEIFSFQQFIISLQIKINLKISYMKPALNTSFVIVFFLFVFTSFGFGQAGKLDHNFGQNGKITTDLDGEDFVYAGVIQSDGNILVGGSVQGYFFGLTRCNTDGSLDYTFGNNGKVISGADFNSTTGILSIAIQKDGKIIAAGGINGGFGMIRYKSSGVVDSTFGTNGVTITRAAEIYSQALNVFIEDDGKIILSGGGNELFNSEFILAKYLSNGSLDSSFGIDGLVKTIFSNGGGAAAASLLPNGDIIQTGPSIEGIQLIKFKPDGSLDNSFGNSGKLFISEKNVYGFGSQTLQNDGKILCSFPLTNTENKYGLLRLNANGFVDSTFGINGRIYGSIFFSPPAIAIQNDGNIIQCGYVQNVLNNSYDFGLVRCHANGVIDSSFGTNGITTTNFNKSGNNYSSDEAASIVLQNDKKIVAVGSSRLSDVSGWDFAVARYIDDGTLPITLTSFTANKNKTSVVLNWQTANEQNNAFFAIERSNNSNDNFNEVGRVNSKRNSNQTQQYLFEDFNPFSGGNYYRLKQVDKDGRTTYSKVVFIYFGKLIAIKLYPNPVKDVLTLEGLTANSKTNISIISLQGSALAKTTATNSTYTWNIKQLPAGTYYVRIEADKNVSTLKFVKE